MKSRSFVPSTLTGRLVVTAVALVTVVSLLIAVSATLVMRAYLTDRLDDQLRGAFDRARTEQREPSEVGERRDGRAPRADGVPLPLGQGEGTVTAVLGSTDRGIVLTRDGRPEELATSVLTGLADVPRDGRPHTVELPGLGVYRVQASTVADGVLVGGVPTRDVDSTIESLIWWEVALVLVGVSVAAAAGRALVSRQLKPLRDVAATAHTVTAMPLSSGEVGRTVRVPDDLTDPDTEVGQVGEALNRLLRHVEEALDARHESEQQVRQFLADASHELRTPLATIQGYAELGRRTDTDQTAKVEEEAARMTALVEDMLTLARLDAGRPLGHEPVDLSRLLAEAVDDARVVDSARAWRLELPDDPVIVPGDAQRLHQAVTNLLRNASRHTPAGTTVTGRVATDDGRARIDIHDDGPGLSPKLVPVVFERFSRGDSSRTRASGGVGLGAALVRAIAEAHRGTASVQSSPGSTTFTIEIPAAD